MPDPRIVALDLNIGAIDLSLSDTGLAGRAPTEDGTPEVFTQVIHYPALPTELAGRDLLHARCRRVLRIRDGVMAFAEQFDFVALEGYSYGSKGNSVYQIAELGGAVRLALHEEGIPFVVVSPNEIKKYATGKGNASKETMLVQAVRRGDQEFTNDTADAWWLLQMALAHYSLPHVPMPKTHAAVLEKIDWPALKAEVPA